MTKKSVIFILVWLLVFPAGILTAQTNLTFSKYHTTEEVQQMLKQFQQNNSANTKLHSIADSPGGEKVSILEIGSNLTDVPAVFVGANFEGNIPLATEGALKLAQMLLDSAEYTSGLKWYIMPQPNPDAAKGFFTNVKYNRTVNSFEVNDDVDDAVNEDGFDDLNGDGYITQMRVKSIEGTHLVSEKDERILKRADTKKGERGMYKIYSEGIDNDGDGRYNEDGPGGINVGIGFPHLFPYDKKEAGLWSGQTPEVYSIMRFIFDRPEIAMVYTLGSSGFCLAPPKSGRKGDPNMDRIKIPSRYARMLGADASKTYSMDEVIEMMKERVPDGTEVTPSMVAGMLGLGAAVNPLEDDLRFYNKFAEEYKEYLKEKDFSTENLDPAPAKDGSFELWAYYHLGVPSFSMNLFTVPKVKNEKTEKEEGALSMDVVEKMDSEEFVALGKENIDKFLKANNAPERFTAERVIQMMESGRFTPEQMVGMIKKMPKEKKEDELSEKEKALLAWSEKEWDGKGFVNWKKVDHPDFDEAEVGGFIPYLETTPKPERIDSLLNAQLPWLLQLSKKIPEISFSKEKITDLGAGVYKLELYIENNGELAYPIAMGQRNSQPAPVVILLDGDVEFLEGKTRRPLGSIGSNQVKKLTWLIKAGKAERITAKIESAVFKTIEKQINIGG
ncbi:MAG: M14 family metallopeptidase [Prolixibacteraceae bacterium]